MHLGTLAPDYNLMLWLVRLATSENPEFELEQFIGSKAWREVVVHLRSRVYRQLDAVLSAPIRVQNTGVGRNVILLESVAYVVNELTMTVRMSPFTKDGEWIHPDTNHRPYDVDTFLCRRNWRNSIRDSVQGRLRSYLNSQWAIALAEEIDVRPAFLPENLHESFWRQIAIGLSSRIRARTRVKPLRFALRAALNIDPSIMALARRSRVNIRRHRISQPWLTFVWQNRDMLERVQREAPTVLAPAAELAHLDAETRSQDPVRRLRRWLTTKGVGNNGWLRLLRHSVRPYRQLMTEQVPRNAMNCLPMALRLTSGVEAPEAICPTVWSSLLSLFPRHDTPQSTLELTADWPRKVFAESAWRARIASKDGNLQQFIRTEWAPILSYLLDPNTLDENQVRAGWKCWLRLARENEQRQRAETNLESWPFAIASWNFDEIEFKSIDNSVDLYDEGVALHHCAQDTSSACTSGRYRCYRVFGPNLRATLGLGRVKGGWKVNELRTYCNGKVSGRARFAAEALAQVYETQFPHDHAQTKATRTPRGKAMPGCDPTESPSMTRAPLGPERNALVWGVTHRLGKSGPLSQPLTNNRKLDETGD